MEQVTRQEWPEEMEAIKKTIQVMRNALQRRMENECANYVSSALLSTFDSYVDDILRAIPPEALKARAAFTEADRIRTQEARQRIRMRQCSHWLRELICMSHQPEIRELAQQIRWKLDNDGALIGDAYDAEKATAHHIYRDFQELTGGNKHHG